LPLAFADGGELISDNQLYSSVTADSSVFDDFGGDWLFENCPGFLREVFSCFLFVVPNRLNKEV
jgi:hypothetical protein